jgi:hypothetical protein
MKVELESSKDNNEFPLTVMVIPANEIEIHITYLSEYFEITEILSYERRFRHAASNLYGQNE